MDLLETPENRSLKSKYFGVTVECPEQFANNLALIKDRQLWLKTIHNCYQEQADCILNGIYLTYVLTYIRNYSGSDIQKSVSPKGKRGRVHKMMKRFSPDM